MKKVITILITVLVVGLLAFGLNRMLTPRSSAPKPAAPVESSRSKDAPPSDLVMGDPLSASGLRFDGVYHADMKDIHYFMRFFPAGHVAMVGGPEDPKKAGSLRAMLRASVLGQRNIGLYNVPVQWRGDSVYMTAKGPKGDILYSCAIQQDKVSVLKESKANGRKAVIEYLFETDPAPVSAEQGK